MVSSSRRICMIENSMSNWCSHWQGILAMHAEGHFSFDSPESPDRWLREIIIRNYLKGEFPTNPRWNVPTRIKKQRRREPSRQQRDFHQHASTQPPKQQRTYGIMRGLQKGGYDQHEDTPQVYVWSFRMSLKYLKTAGRANVLIWRVQGIALIWSQNRGKKMLVLHAQDDANVVNLDIFSDQDVWRFWLLDAIHTRQKLKTCFLASIYRTEAVGGNRQQQQTTLHVLRWRIDRKCVYSTIVSVTFVHSFNS